ncbi:hypothetical protein HDF13_003856 [Edaphobacter lichenicola]|uniref:Uncharacterized protein n=1 Tax=Tunturiibacter gelidiferens TaxID=3069689 RepID=A0ACC5P4K7_9BACT|nr:hypothetical protein [Edaphobacter lichenicola]
MKGEDSTELNSIGLPDHRVLYASLEGIGLKATLATVRNFKQGSVDDRNRKPFGKYLVTIDCIIV